jgi:hypothetical protein
MHCKKITYLGTFPSHTTDQTLRETSQVEAVYHMKRSHSTLLNNITFYKHFLLKKALASHSVKELTINQKNHIPELEA